MEEIVKTGINLIMCSISIFFTFIQAVSTCTRNSRSYHLLNSTLVDCLTASEEGRMSDAFCRFHVPVTVDIFRIEKLPKTEML